MRDFEVLLTAILNVPMKLQRLLLHIFDQGIVAGDRIALLTSVSALAGLLGKSAATVKRYVKDLKSLPFVEVESGVSGYSITLVQAGSKPVSNRAHSGVNQGSNGAHLGLNPVSKNPSRTYA